MYKNRHSPSRRSWNNDGLHPPASSDSSKAPGLSGAGSSRSIGILIDDPAAAASSSLLLVETANTAPSAANPSSRSPTFDAEASTSQRPAQLYSHAAFGRTPHHHRQQQQQPMTTTITTTTAIAATDSELRHLGSNDHALALRPPLNVADLAPSSEPTVRSPALSSSLTARRPALNLVYQDDSYGGSGTGVVDRFKQQQQQQQQQLQNQQHLQHQQQLQYQHHQQDASYRYGPSVVPAEMADDSQACFWLVPRLSQGLPGAADVSDPRVSGMPDFPPPLAAGTPNHHLTLCAPTAAGPSYLNAESSPVPRHPVVYSQPAGYGGISGTWSSSSTPTTEYPTASYVLQTRRLHQDEEMRQRYMHDACSERDEDDGGRSASSQAAVAAAAAAAAAEAGTGTGAVGMNVPVAGFFDQHVEDAALWPLGPSQLAAVVQPAGHAADYSEPPLFNTSMPMSMPPGGSPDRERQKAKVGPALPLIKQFKCSACDAIFSRNHDLKRHARIHLAVKPFPCKFCEKAFSRKDALKRHVLVKGCGLGNKKNRGGRRRAKGGGISGNGDAAMATAGQGRVDASIGMQALEGEDASPDSPFDSQQQQHQQSQYYDYGHRDCDGGSVAMEATPSFEHGAPGSPVWRSFGPGLGPHDGPGGLQHSPYVGAHDGAMAGFRGPTAPYGVDVRHMDTAGPTDRYHVPAGGSGSGSDLRFHPHPHPHPDTARAQLRSSSLANAYPSEMATMAAANHSPSPSPSPSSRRAYGMPASAAAAAAAAAGFLQESDVGRQMAVPRPGSEGQAATGDRGTMSEPSSLVPPYGAAAVAAADQPHNNLAGASYELAGSGGHGYTGLAAASYRTQEAPLPDQEGDFRGYP